MCYARTTQQTSDAEPTLAQRWFTVYDAGPTPHQNRFNVSCPPGTTYENIESRSPGKTQTTTQSGFTAGPPFRMPAQQQNNIGPMPASPGQSRHQQAKTLSQSRPKSWTIVYDDDPTTRRHRPIASPANPSVGYSASAFAASEKNAQPWFRWEGISHRPGVDPSPMSEGRRLTVFTQGGLTLRNECNCKISTTLAYVCINHEKKVFFFNLKTS